MRDEDCVRFLQWALPRLGLRWTGFRKVRGQVCKRIGRRLEELDLDGLDAYRERLAVEPDEWRVLDRMCRVTISRLWRDRETFRGLETVVLPALAADSTRTGVDTLDVWSCGCASGEEPYSIAMLWHERLAGQFPDVELRILATDVDLHLLRRAGRAVYPVGAAREVPRDLASVALEPAGVDDSDVRIVDRVREGVHVAQHDVRDGTPAGPFHLVVCRNLVFTYFDAAIQRQVAERLVEELRPGGALVVGGHETLPDDLGGVAAWPDASCTFRRITRGRGPR
jgi:chemotaxis protein methyltransferase CheR